MKHYGDMMTMDSPKFSFLLVGPEFGGVGPVTASCKLALALALGCPIPLSVESVHLVVADGVDTQQCRKGLSTTITLASALGIGWLLGYREGQKEMRALPNLSI